MEKIKQNKPINGDMLQANLAHAAFTRTLQKTGRLPHRQAVRYRL